MLANWTVLLESIVANPDELVSRLALLTASERQQLTVEWAVAPCNGFPTEHVVQSVERRAEKTPEAVAVEYEGESWSYRELNERANQLARYLQELGVGPEVLVGLCVERSLEMM